MEEFPGRDEALALGPPRLPHPRHRASSSAAYSCGGCDCSGQPSEPTSLSCGGFAIGGEWLICGCLV